MAKNKINNFDTEHKKKILNKYYDKFALKNKGVWHISTIDIKNIISETWDLSKILNKHKKLNMDDVFWEVKLSILEEVSNKYIELPSKDFALYLAKKIKELEE